MYSPTPFRAALAVLAVLLLGAAPARAAVVLDAFAQGSASNSPDLTDTRFTVGTGADRLMIITVSLAGNASATSVSFRGVPAQRVSFVSTGVPAAPCRAELWRIVAPPVGLGLVAVTVSSPTAFGVGVVSYSGVDQSTPTTAASSGTGMSSPVRIMANVPDGRPLLGVACLGGTWPMRAGPDAVAGLGDTGLWDFTEPSVVGLGSQQASPGTAQVSWNVTWSGSFAWAALGMTINPSAASPDAGVDAGADAASDAASDTGPPDTATMPPDAPAPPDVGQADAGADGQEPDADELPDADVVVEVDAEEPADGGADEPTAPPADAGVSPDDGDGTTARDVNLRVGCACRVGDVGRPSAGLFVLLIVIARRRRRV